MIMLSTSRDPVCPGFHQTAYRNAVAASGDLELLVLAYFRLLRSLHLTPEEIATAFRDLIAWVEFGIKPAP